MNATVIISGKINFYKKRYQITNPDYVTSFDKINILLKKFLNIV